MEAPELPTVLDLLNSTEDEKQKFYWTRMLQNIFDGNYDLAIVRLSQHIDDENFETQVLAVSHTIIDHREKLEEIAEDEDCDIEQARILFNEMAEEDGPAAPLDYAPNQEI